MNYILNNILKRGLDESSLLFLFYWIFIGGQVMNYEYKEVYYDKYCETCKYADVDDAKDPCNECLGEPTNLHSHKPIKYEKKLK